MLRVHVGLLGSVNIHSEVLRSWKLLRGRTNDSLYVTTIVDEAFDMLMCEYVPTELPDERVSKSKVI